VHRRHAQHELRLDMLDRQFGRLAQQYRSALQVAGGYAWWGGLVGIEYAVVPVVNFRQREVVGRIDRVCVRPIEGLLAGGAVCFGGEYSHLKGKRRVRIRHLVEIP